MDFTARYAKLNDAQKEAVNTIDGPVMVVAGPGTGKTELLSMRTANILQKTDTLPENILCLTFTDSGADAMRERLISIIGQDAYKVAIHTFHSFGAEVINQNGEFFYRGASFQPADTLSSHEILRGIFDKLEYTSPLAAKMNDEYTYLNDTFRTISELKRSGLTSAELLQILDANDEAMDRVERQLAEVFSSRISATTLSLLIPVAHTIAETEYPQLPTDVTPLSHVLATSLAHAVDEAQTTDSTKPITAWKNQWLEKDSTGALVFKSRKRQNKLRAVAALYDSYLARMQEAELFDFDDMILEVVHAIETQPDLKYNLQERYQYIMVDEFQDTNLAQSRILHNLTDNEVNNDRPNILVVGDDDQAIYAFQGADVSNILNFRSTYENAKLIVLTENYRSTAPILEAAREVISQGTDRLESYVDELDKTLNANSSADAYPVTIVEHPSCVGEQQWITADIAARIKKGQDPSSIAVIARRHTELADLLPYFHEEGIPVRYERQDNVLDNEIVMQLELLTRCIVMLTERRHAEANALLPEILSHPAWELSSDTLWKLSLTAYRDHKLWLEIMETTPELTPIAEWLKSAAKETPHMTLEQALDLLLGSEEKTEGFCAPYFKYYFAPEKLVSHASRYIDYLEALRAIRRSLREYYTSSKPDLATFLAFIQLHRDAKTPIMLTRLVGNIEGTVNLMTAHKSKGLEFDTVYVMGAIDTTWGEKVRSRGSLIGYPENLALSVPGSTLDERLRLFFVAMTRAKQELFISYSSHTDTGKDSFLASFLIDTPIKRITVASKENLQEQLAEVKRAWYAPLIAPISLSMQDAVRPLLNHYKLSVTHLNNFLDISRGGPEHFLLANLLHFPSAMSSSAAYGSAIHATLQQAHNHLKATGEYRPQEDIVHDFEQHLTRHRLSDNDHEVLLQRGSDALGAFLAAKYDSFSRSQRVELSFGGQQVMIGDAKLTGALDLVDINDELKTIHVTDYKTGKAPSSWQGKTDYEKIKLHKYKQQLIFYKLLIEQSRDFSTYTVPGGTLQFVEPTPHGDIISLDVTFNDEEVEAFKRLIQAIWQHIVSLDFPDTSSYEPTYKGMLAFEADLLEKSN
jgi:DNA helicase-2/ATP-dependent DNA helicase PcrA